MAVRLSRIKGDTRTVTLNFGEEGDLTVTYRPGVMTPAREEQLVIDEREGRGVRAVVSLLAEMVVDWDLLDDDGQPIARDVDVLMSSLPADVLVMLLDAIKRVDSPGEANGAT